MRGSVMRTKVTLIPWICVASFPGLHLPLRADFLLSIKLCSRIAHSGGRRPGNVLYSTASMRALVALSRTPHEATPLLPRLLGTPLAESWLCPCVTSRPFQVVDLPLAPFLFGKFLTPKIILVDFFCAAKNHL